MARLNNAWLQTIATNINPESNFTIWSIVWFRKRANTLENLNIKIISHEWNLWDIFKVFGKCIFKILKKISEKIIPPTNYKTNNGQTFIINNEVSIRDIVVGIKDHLEGICLDQTETKREFVREYYWKFYQNISM